MQHEYRPLAGQAFLPILPTLLPLPIPITANPIPIDTPSGPPLSEDEHLNGEIPKTCARCSYLYRHADNIGTACGFHPGYFRDSRLTGMWSCCKQLSQNAGGCQRTFHIESKQASDNLKHFLTNTHSSSTSLDSHMPAEPFPPKRRKIRAETTPQDGFVTHLVLPVDTIEGVCLRYDITVSELAKYNRGLTASSFPAFRQILIPVGVDDDIVLESGVSPEEKQKMEQEKLRFRFAKVLRTTPEVAAAYLSSNDYNYDEAVKDYQEDLNFEKAENVTPKVAASRSTKFTAMPSSKK